MSSIAKKPATYEDLLKVPDPLVAEIVAGELYASPRPASPHAFASSSLGMDIGGAFQKGRGGPGGWWILFEPELHFRNDIVVPDLAGWRKERMPDVPDAAFFTLAPDWLCEVLSPSTSRLDRAAKLPVYAREGVANVWLVDPLQQTVEVFRLTNGQWLLVNTFAGDACVRVEPFEAIELDLSELWFNAPRAQ
ncbi:MAG: Uma2 family endonuclease [Myxococcota bacterium]